MKNLFLFFIFLFPSLLHSSLPYMEISAPNVISSNTSLDAQGTISEGKTLPHSITIEVHPGSPRQGWRLYLHLEPEVEGKYSSSKASAFPLFWRKVGGPPQFQKLYSSKALVEEEIPGFAKDIRIEILLNSDWDLFADTYQANLVFTLESIL